MADYSKKNYEYSMDENMDFLNLHDVKKKMNKYQKFYPKKILASIYEGYLGSLTENVSNIDFDAAYALKMSF